MNIFNEAIEKHAQWKMVLKNHIDEGISPQMKEIADYHYCDLGRWIYGEGLRYNRLPSFETMCIAHEQFHRAAAEVVHYSNVNNKAKARALMSPDGAFTQSSSRLTKALMQCGKDLAESLLKDVGTQDTPKVRDLLQSKPNNDVLFIESPATVRDAIKMMVDNNTGSIAVNVKGKFHGIFSEHGFFQNIVYKGGISLDAPVSEVVDMNTLYVDPDDSVEQCLLLMTSMHTHHLPVLDHGNFVGVIGMGDILKHIVACDGDKIFRLESHLPSHYTPDKA
ncbi:MAG: CBS domain-containing protein [Gammaproteobacteria bacterium]